MIQLPSIECDFNAFGLSDEPEDRCYYSFDRARVMELVNHPDDRGGQLV
jgi:hypothetical protein